MSSAAASSDPLHATPPPGRPAAAVRGRGRGVALAVALMVVTILTYVRVFDAGFVRLDDQRHLLENSALNPPSWDGLLRLWTQPYAGIYVPAAYTYFAGEMWMAQRLGGSAASSLEPWLFHAGNLLLHIACVLLVFAILRRLVERDVAAALGALLFAIHPIQVESVAWISETRGTLAGMFSFLAIYAYVRFVEPDAEAALTAGNSGLSKRLRWPFYALASTCYLLALLSKPSAVSVPFMLAVLELIWFRRRRRQAALALGWWLLPAAALAWLTSDAQGDAIAGLPFDVAWWQRPFVAADALAFYLVKLVVPVGLSIDYGRSPPVVMASYWVYVVWLIPVVLVVVLSRLPHGRVWLTCAGLFAAGLLPVLGFVTFGFQETSTVGDRYIYLAMLGPALALAWLPGHAASRVLYFDVAIVLLLLAILAVRQTLFWHDSGALFGRALETNPASVLALNSLALACLDERQFDEAERHMRRAIEIRPGDARLYNDLGVVFVRGARMNDAVSAFARAIEVQPDYLPPQLYLGMIYTRRGAWNEAIAALRRVVEVEPGLLQAHYYLATALVASGRPVDSVAHWQVLVDNSPDDVKLRRSLGMALLQAGRADEAREAIQAVLERRPDDAEAAELLRLLEAARQDDATAAPPAAPVAETQD